MQKKLPTILLVTMVFATVAVLVSGQVWAQAQFPCEAQRVFTFDDGSQVRVSFDVNTNCTDVTAVEFCLEPPCADSDWETPVGRPGTICVCTVRADATDPDAECSPYLEVNLANTANVDVDCHPIRHAGVAGRGCPIYGSTTYTSSDGYVYSRSSSSGVETNCTDGIDNDRDRSIDCADSDCSGDPACQ